MKKEFMKYILFLIPMLFLTQSCKKCNLKGDSLLVEEFNEYGDWLLYSEYSETDQFYSRIKDGVLKLKSEQGVEGCQRATYYFNQDFSSIKGFQICIDIKELKQPKNVDLHFYVALGKYELHGTIEKRKTTNTRLVFKVDEKGVNSNLRGAVFGHLGDKIEPDNNATDFIQISLCPEDWEESTGELYLEIERLEITTL